MLKKIRNFIIKNELIKYGDGIVIGLSGGADSVCLFMVLLMLKEEFNLKLTVVHVNHCLRGEAADQDEKYVVSLCSKNNIECAVKKIDIKQTAKEFGLSEEEAGRKVRYEMFYSVLSEKGYNKIAVAHHINDNAETVLFNIFRGTGVRGACGIPLVNGSIIRPLLCVTKNEIEVFLKDLGVGWQTDLTNYSEDYSRNCIRNKIFQYAQENINKQSVLHIDEFSKRLSEMYSFVHEYAQKEFERLVILSNINRRLELDALEYKKLQNIIADEVLYIAFKNMGISVKNITSVHYEAIRNIIYGASGKEVILPGRIKVLNASGRIIILKPLVSDEENNKEKADKTSKVNKIDKSNSIECAVSDLYKKVININIENYELSLTIEDYNGEPYPKLKEEVWFDADRLFGTLKFRTRQKGDEIVINPDGRKKSIKALFIEKKIPVCDRDNIYMLVYEDEILWVLGIRSTEARRVKSATRQVLKVHYYV